MNFSWPENVQRVNGKKGYKLLCRELKRNFPRGRLEHEELLTDIWQQDFHVRNSCHLVSNNKISEVTSYETFQNNNYNKDVPEIKVKSDAQRWRPRGR